MKEWLTGRRLVGLGLVLLAGATFLGAAIAGAVVGSGAVAGSTGAAGFFPQTQLHAVSTDRIETFAIATGPVDDEVEAVYFLDFLTGDLRATVMGKQGNKFQAFFTGNVLEVLGVEATKRPKFLMVTGMADLRRGGAGLSVQPGRALVYVAEVTSGKVAAFAIPWSPSMRATGQIIRQKLVPIDVTQFRSGSVPGTDE